MKEKKPKEVSQETIETWPPFEVLFADFLELPIEEQLRITNKLFHEPDIPQDKA